MKSFATLFKNEMKLNIRNMNMIIFAVIMPLVVLIILGCIYGTKPAFDGAEYTFLEQSFGALCTISICAGGLMGLPLVVSEYRERTILKRFQVTPVSPLKLLIVEFSVYVVYCIVSMLTLIPTAMLIWKVRIIGFWSAFFGKLAVDHGIYPEYRNDGRRCGKKFKKRKCYCLHSLLPDVVFFGCDASV